MRSFRALLRVLPVLVAVGWPSALAGQPTKRPTDEERGKELWARHCASCHGATNHGDGPATAALVVPVPDLAGKVKAEKATIEVVLNGRAGMPGFEASFDYDDARRVMLFMAKADQAPADPKKPGEPAPSDDAEDPGPGDAQGEGPG